jgi:hypothetical protein
MITHPQKTTGEEYRARWTILTGGYLVSRSGSRVWLYLDALAADAGTLGS